jgi:protein gp37
MRAEWVRAIRDACAEEGVAFHFKQWGGVSKKASGRMLDGRTWDEMPAWLPQISANTNCRRELVKV